MSNDWWPNAPKAPRKGRARKPASKQAALFPSCPACAPEAQVPNLPPGRSCQDCAHFALCEGELDVQASRRTCLYGPSRYEAEADATGSRTRSETDQEGEA